jgi:TRAP-type C4-dicarboxylate transport system substrate-binding protein
LWKAAKFQPVALDSTAIPQALMSGTIAAVPMPPFVVLAGSLDRHAKHMLELNWAPLIGAMIVRKATWERLAPPLREKFLESARAAGVQIKADGRAEATRSVAAMVKRGLKVQPVSAEVEAEWRAIIDTLADRIRGRIVPAEMYDEAQRILKEYRAAPAKNTP